MKDGGKKNALIFILMSDYMMKMKNFADDVQNDWETSLADEWHFDKMK